MRRAAKYTLATAGGLVVIVSALYVLAVGIAFRAHYDEDRIVLGGKNVEYAINDYVEKHGSPPVKLDDLIPVFMASMPSFPQVSNVHYRVAADGHGWTLDIDRPRGDSLLTYRRTNTGLSPEDTKRWVHTENGCYVLKLR